VELITDDVKLFHTPDRRPYATYVVSGHQETSPVNSTQFQDYLAHRFYGYEESALKVQALHEALGVIKAKALFDGKELPVPLRVAELEGNIYLDLNDSSRRAVEITSSGRSIVKLPPVRFRRPNGMMAVPAPAPRGHISNLRRFVNVKDEDFVLLVMWLIAALRPSGPYPVLALHGEQGSAKSTTARVLRALVDPSKALIRALPQNERDLMISASCSHILAFDNISHLDPWLSDALCRLATGGGIATRKLYTDEEEIIFEAQRPVLLNGIEDVAGNGDLLDRMLVLSLPEISEKKRKVEAVFWKEFESVRPQVLGALLRGVSAALKNLPAVKLEEKPRMADFAMWATAAECALGFKAGEFIHAYNRNRKEASDIALESSPVAIAVHEFMQKKNEWKGTSGELLNCLKGSGGRAWPITPKGLSNALERSKPNLRNAGITIQRLPREAGTGKRFIRLQKRLEAASQPSQSSQGRSDQGDACDGSCDVRCDDVCSTETPFPGSGDGVTVRDGGSQSRSPPIR